jgi:tryptophan synthase alpha chain
LPSTSDPSADAPRARGLGRGFARGRSALVVYLMAGYPDRERSLEALHVVRDAGADIIELGVPFADPLADGPVIRDAAETARSANPGGFGLAETIDLAGEFITTAARSGTATPPVALMTYLNPIMRVGYAPAAERMRVAGVGGVIVPDMPPDSAAPWLASAAGIDTVFLAAPTSTPERLALIGERSSGFVYCVSTTGVTGERAELPADLTDLVARVKANTRLPVAVGFGVSTPGQASLVAGIADGVVVGSAVVRRQDDPVALAAFVRELAQAVHMASASS